ncbi:ATP-binding cassette domain-containing protein [Cellulomonas endophytica]|uniref:ATP-binding cassette domain-containing protein n=1 Tax=Cellulomonas endophytica TaxID=2494735 RepID=UPI001010B9CD|nr:ABC transporter ATP-binding protein [Cellulomonas endophytica]
MTPSTAARPSPLRRLTGRATTLAVAAAVVAAAAETAGTVVAGRLAEGPTSGALALLAALLGGATLLDTAGRTAFAGVLARAEGVLRRDLLAAALRQPLPVLDEQAVGEVLDRVDDDPRQLAALARRTGWEVGRAALRAVLAWVVAGLTWTPAWVVFPLVAVAALAVARPLTRLVAQRKVAEEVAWSEHSAQLEEAVAARDDVRSSLGQPHVVRSYARRAGEVLRRVRASSDAAATVALRTGLVLHALVAALAVGGVALVTGDRLGVAGLVTLWLLVTSFVGQLARVADQLPEVQAGLGALQRVDALLTAPPEPAGGAPVPPGPVAVELRGLDFAYPGGFALRGVDLVVPAGTSIALVGRTGAGKSTVVRLLSRAVEPPPGTVLVGGQDVTATDLEDLRRAVGVVTQRTEVLAATLAENIALLADVPRAAVERAVAALGIEEWVASLPQGLDTPLGPGGSPLSAGEEQLVAFARLLVRDVQVVVLDEATARMDPQTEALVTRASDRLLAGRTGVVVAHRLSTTRRCDAVAVMEAGRVVQHGPRAALATTPGPFRDLLTASGGTDAAGVSAPLTARAERRSPRPRPPVPEPSLPRTVLRLVLRHKRWGLLGDLGFLATMLLGVSGAVTGWLWGRLVASLGEGGAPWGSAALLAASVLVAPVALAFAVRLYFVWWQAVTLRMRLAVLVGQTRQHRLPRVPPGEAVARVLDSERMVLYVDRWVDVVNGLLVVLATGLVSSSALAAAVVAAVLVLSAAISAAGAPVVGRTARVAGDERARFGHALASVLDSARTLKLAAAVRPAQRYLQRADDRRVAATVRELRVRAALEGIPPLLVQAGVVTAWGLHLTGTWGLATALLVTTAVSGSGWFGTVAAAAITEAPVARRWLRATAELAGTDDLVALPDGVDLVDGTAPGPADPPRVPLRRLTIEGLTAVHDDGTVGVSDVDLAVEAGELVLLVGRVGAGKSSLLAALAGLVDHEGTIRWNDHHVEDPQTFLRPGQVAYVAQVPRVLSGSFAANVHLDHDRPWGEALQDARLGSDVAAAGGHEALVGHRGVRLSGGQVQRLALARARATRAELLVADDVSSALDARTEVELWDGLRARGLTVVGASTKSAALDRADRVVVLEEGRVAAAGPWAELRGTWGHLAG